MTFNTLVFKDLAAMAEFVAVLTRQGIAFTAVVWSDEGQITITGY